ncbi:hypothetical protein WG66_013275 [Moniliophthora roreri]|nr:hypothetical protein WG66_013275 [Moniliophthora roreri]
MINAWMYNHKSKLRKLFNRIHRREGTVKTASDPKKRSQVRASQVCVKHLDVDEKSSAWKIYFGFYPWFVPEIDAWYRDTDTLERNIQSKIEADSQNRYHMELSRLAIHLEASSPAIPLTARVECCYSSSSCWYAVPRWNLAFLTPFLTGGPFRFVLYGISDLGNVPAAAQQDARTVIKN